MMLKIQKHENAQRNSGTLSVAKFENGNSGGVNYMSIFCGGAIPWCVLRKRPTLLKSLQAACPLTITHSPTTQTSTINPNYGTGIKNRPDCRKKTPVPPNLPT